ncbi:MAG: glycine--tRNA ligase subunit beta, partial [Desulfocapsa sp.]
MSELLFEIGTEELPAGFQEPALAQLKENFIREAKSLNLEFDSVRCMGTPRRLALLVEGLADRQPDSRVELLGPSKKAGFDADGHPSKAAMGFARSKGADVDDLQVVETDKGEYLMLVKESKGAVTAELIPDMLKILMQSFSFAKSMRWGSCAFTFARPIQWLLALHDGAVVPFIHEGVTAGNTTRGHRFMAPGDIVVSGLDAYEKVLADAFVLVD